jgi:hypothetical protein
VRWHACFKKEVEENGIGKSDVSGPTGFLRFRLRRVACDGGYGLFRLYDGRRSFLLLHFYI